VQTLLLIHKCVLQEAIYYVFLDPLNLTYRKYYYKDGKPHKVHLVANLRIDGKRCWGMKIPINSGITCANKPKNKFSHIIRV
jgi:hypothetical protein